MPAPDLAPPKRSEQMGRTGWGTGFGTPADPSPTPPSGPAPYDPSASVALGQEATKVYVPDVSYPEVVADRIQATLTDSALRFQSQTVEIYNTAAHAWKGKRYPGGGPVGQHIVQVARQQIGDPYVWGASGPDKFDCSGLLYYCLNKSGIRVPRLTADGYLHMAMPLRKGELQPGDLVFFDWNGDNVQDHCGIYIGGGQMIAAPHTGAVVSVSPVSWSFARYGRIR